MAQTKFKKLALGGKSGCFLTPHGELHPTLFEILAEEAKRGSHTAVGNQKKKGFQIQTAVIPGKSWFFQVGNGQHTGYGKQGADEQAG